MLNKKKKKKKKKEKNDKIYRRPQNHVNTFHRIRFS